MLKKALCALLLVIWVFSVAAAAPKALSILINDTPFAGKALWYRDRVYVSVEDLAATLNATYSYTPGTGQVRLILPASSSVTPAPRPAASRSNGSNASRPYVQVVSSRQFFFPDNVKVLVTFKNIGDQPARGVEATCVFKDTMLAPINAELRQLGDLAPGETRSAEYYLFPTGGYVPGGVPNYTWGFYGFGVADSDKISVRGQLTTVYHEFILNYPGAPDLKGR